VNYEKITISGLICTGKSSLFLNLHQQLKWPTFSASGFFREYARTHNVSLEQAEEQSDKITKKVDYGMQIMLAKPENLIVEGWMAGVMADNRKEILRILLQCKDETRYERFAKREKTSIKEAQQKILAREKNLAKALKRIHNCEDSVDPAVYNCIVDTTNLTESQLLQVVLDKLGFDGNSH